MWTFFASLWQFAWSFKWVCRVICSEVSFFFLFDSIILTLHLVQRKLPLTWGIAWQAFILAKEGDLYLASKGSQACGMNSFLIPLLLVLSLVLAQWLLQSGATSTSGNWIIFFTGCFTPLDETTMRFSSIVEQSLRKTSSDHLMWWIGPLDCQMDP